MKSKPTPESERTEEADLTEEELFDGRVRKARPVLLRIAEHLTQDADCAEDLVQEGVLRAWEQRDSYGGEGSYEGWVVTIMVNLWKDERRKRGLQHSVPFEEHEHLLEPQLDPEEIRCRQQRRRVLDAALDDLTTREQEALLAHFVDGLSLSAVARELKVSRKAAKELVRQACLKLRSMEDVLELALDEALEPV